MNLYVQHLTIIYLPHTAYSETVSKWEQQFWKWDKDHEGMEAHNLSTNFKELPSFLAFWDTTTLRHLRMPKCFMKNLLPFGSYSSEHHIVEHLTPRVMFIYNLVFFHQKVNSSWAAIMPNTLKKKNPAEQSTCFDTEKTNVCGIEPHWIHTKYWQPWNKENTHSKVLGTLSGLHSSQMIGRQDLQFHSLRHILRALLRVLNSWSEWVAQPQVCY